jgi:hypothetical protein
LRDVFVTEYGIADLRDKSDKDVIAAMLSVADSRFQPHLLREAKAAKKIPDAYEIPQAFRNNTPERIAAALEPSRAQGHLPLFPLGTDFDATEIRLLPALELLDRASWSAWGLVRLATKGLFAAAPGDEPALLARMKLDAPKSPQDRVYRLLLSAAIRMTSGVGRTL